MPIRIPGKTHNILAFVLLTNSLFVVGSNKSLIEQQNIVEPRAEQLNALVEQQDAQREQRKQQLEREVVVRQPSAITVIKEILQPLMEKTEADLKQLIRNFAPLRVYREGSRWFVESSAHTAEINGGVPEALESIVEMKFFMFDIKNIEVQKSGIHVGLRSEIDFPRMLVKFKQSDEFQEIVKATNYNFELDIHFKNMELTVKSFSKFGRWWSCSHNDRTVNEIFAPIAWYMASQADDNVPRYENVEKWCSWLESVGQQH